MQPSVLPAKLDHRRPSAATRLVTLLWLAGLAALAAPLIEVTTRGVVIETDRYRVEFRDGVLSSLTNRLTGEAYLDSTADPAATVPHLPSGLGTQHGEPARAAADTLYHWPWWEHPNDLYLPNQHYPDDASTCSVEVSANGAVVTYTGLTDGRERFDDEVYRLALEVDAATGDLLITPDCRSPRQGVYAANLTLAPLAPAVTAEAPITDGVRISRDNTGQVLWSNQWPDYWQYGFIAFNGWKRGAVAIWAEDARLRTYKQLFYLNNGQGLSFALSMMNVPPFEELTEASPTLPWRLQAFDTSWAQGVERYRQWRDANVKLAPRPAFAQQISFIASLAGPQPAWLDRFVAYTSPWQGRAAAFLTNVRAQPFDHNHADNTPYPTFADDTRRWREAGTYGMAYLQPMIMWGPFRPEAERSEREKLGLRWHLEAETRLVFQPDPTTNVPYIDQHHLGEPDWQRWFLDWVHDWCHDYGAQGIYHDQSYHAPIDRRGLDIDDKTSPEGMADYFYKAATENPGTFHGTEMVNECNAVAVANSIGSGYHWGTAPNMRLARVYGASPITAALASPHTVLWSFLRLRGDSTFDLRARRMAEARGQIAGAIDGPFDYNVDPKWFPALCNTPWHDRTRDVTFLRYGLRPAYPADYSRDVYSYFRGAQGEDFRYEMMPWGSRFVRLQTDGSRRLIYGVVTGVQAVPAKGVGIAGWLVYNEDDPASTWNRTGPAGLDPDRWYVLDPTIARPPVWFSTDNGYGPSFYEAYVEDSGYNDYLAFIRLRTIEKLLAVSGWERLTLHCPTPPVTVYVNGKPVAVKPKTEGGSEYALSVQAPADIVVILKQPPAELHQAALLRVTEGAHPVDYYRPEAISGQADGGLDAVGRPVLQDASVSPFGFQFGGRKHLYVPLAAPAGSRGGTMRLHLPVPAERGQKWNRHLDSLAINLQPVALAETVEVPLKPGEVKLLSVDTQPLTGATAQDAKATTTRVSLEWVEAAAP